MAWSLERLLYIGVEVVSHLLQVIVLEKTETVGEGAEQPGALSSCRGSLP